MVKDILETKLAMALDDIHTRGGSTSDVYVLESAVISIHYKLDALLKLHDAQELFAMPILDVAHILADIDDATG